MIFQNPRRLSMRVASATRRPCATRLLARYASRMRPSGSSVTRFSGSGRSSETASQSTPRATQAS